MSKNIQLTIPKPCHENWDAMSAVEKGKFCGSCQKQVIDFTNMSDRQLAEFFKKPSTGSVCGRFMTDQLERDLTVPKKRLPWLQYFFTVAIPAFFASKVAAQQVPKIVGKIAYRPVKDTVKLTTVEPIRMLGEVSSTIRPFTAKDTTKNNHPLICSDIVNATVSGKIVNDKGEPIPNASLHFTTRGNTITADNKGEFVFPDRWLKEGEMIIFSSIGFTNKTIPSSLFKKERMLVKLMSEPPVCTPRVTMGIIAYVEPTVTPTKKEKLPTPKKEDKIKASMHFSIEVYPNPVVNGHTVHFKLNHSKEGYHQLQIISLQGQTVYQKEIWIDAAAKVFSIELPVMAAGTYVLQVAHTASGEKTSEKMVVQ
jgi:hypothetical protein